MSAFLHVQMSVRLFLVSGQPAPSIWDPYAKKCTCALVHQENHDQSKDLLVVTITVKIEKLQSFD